MLCLLLVVRSYGAPVTRFQAEGDCYELASKYLATRNIAYIISDDMRGRHCTWNFQGNTQADFIAWCNYEGYRCGGNPFYVGIDSVWHNGEYMQRTKKDYMESQERERNAERVRQDSIRTYKPEPLSDKRVTIEYLEIGKSTAERLGFSYSDYIGTATFFHWEDLFSVTVQARALQDTLFTYRTYTSMYDSTLHVFWGGQRDKIKSSNVTANGIVSNDYVTETYGLTFDIDNMRYKYTHSSDYEHSISGTGKLREGRNAIFGAFQRTYTLETGLPGLMNIPFLGVLFRHVSDETETRFVFIYVTIGGDNGME